MHEIVELVTQLLNADISPLVMLEQDTDADWVQSLQVCRLAKQDVSIDLALTDVKLLVFLRLYWLFRDQDRLRGHLNFLAGLLDVFLVELLLLDAWQHRFFFGSDLVGWL